MLAMKKYGGSGDIDPFTIYISKSRMKWGRWYPVRISAELPRILTEGYHARSFFTRFLDGTSK